MFLGIVNRYHKANHASFDLDVIVRGQMMPSDSKPALQAASVVGYPMLHYHRH